MRILDQIHNYILGFYMYQLYEKLITNYINYLQVKPRHCPGFGIGWQRKFEKFQF